jgi:hypothetical protein
MRRATVAIAALAACVCAGAPPAAAQTSASIQPSFLPDRLGAGTSFTLSFRFFGGEEGVPPPLSGIVVHLPAGLSVNLTGVESCAKNRLRRLGAAGCPPGSLLGRGHALMKVHAGSQTLPEAVMISVFRGVNRGGAPTFEILGRGATPLDESTISSAVLSADLPPYGSKLTVSVPAIPTVMYEPDASFSALSLTIGDVRRPPRAHAAGTVRVPRTCPAGGFPFAADFTFADASSARATARLGCR